MSQPLLEGVVVVDLSGVGPGSRCSRVLADFGATILKVRPPVGSAVLEIPSYAYGGGRGFHTLRVDLKSERGRNLVLRLAQGADVFLESYRPGVARRLGLAFEDVSAVKPDIVYCSISGFGQCGPYAGWAGHDLNYQALAGVLGTTSRRADGGPAIPGVTIGDGAGGGMHAALSILAALAARSKDDTASARCLDVSVTEGVLYLNSLHVDRYLRTGEEAGPGNTLTTGQFACYDVYPARDGKWLAVGAIEARFFANLCRELGCETWIDQQYDDAVQDLIRADFHRRFASKDRDLWVDQLASKDTCVSPIYDVTEVVHDAHLIARGVFADWNDPELGHIKQVGSILAGGTPDAGMDTSEILRVMGMNESEISELEQRTAV